ncbi:NF-kappa-B inhibitor-like protein 1 [Latimeria chalumnae]|uniref:NF-kappa-B inhibitor-like protein 1 n=1 Tax=Latimeria chalumnae TaxID=7897 RepID=H3A0H5_LATCH|nr:PREDICTED: NF-kappa-B inhibitor-like protein 1 [Latimeria chalumnae]XP_006011261.1 PREDICTED: NF-kappa-B inhibitor-like protein 1 [Latimeria chalumnae]|eukprot:XP_006011260.1 PREDICTED: NF-kappa-B inhibitor-like protein 1 [Latimeria chalumnae]
MASRKQKKVMRYVDEGSVLKLKSYLRKHRHLSLNFALRKGRTPLHAACSLHDHAVLRLLLKRGADPLSRDMRGNTPLHIAARQAVAHGKRVYDDLVVPLRKHCPVAMEMPDMDGVTPEDILRWMKGEKYFSDPARENSNEKGSGKTAERAAEREWYQKLFGECEDEFYQDLGRYEDDFCQADPEPESYNEWASRMAREYTQKCRQTEARHSRRNAKTEEEEAAREQRQREQAEFQRRLEAEHQRYLAQADRKQEEVKRAKKERYEEQCAAVFAGRSESTLRYADIPWPCPRGSVEDMTAVILQGVDRGDAEGLRRYLRRQRALWHPDKFLQRCSGRLVETDRKRILDTVTALSQALNKLSDSIK